VGGFDVTSISKLESHLIGHVFGHAPQDNNSIITFTPELPHNIRVKWNDDPIRGAEWRTCLKDFDAWMAPFASPTNTAPQNALPGSGSPNSQVCRESNQDVSSVF
jgi:hypothetical protein